MTAQDQTGYRPSYSVYKSSDTIHAPNRNIILGLDIPAQAKWLYIALCAHADSKTGECFPSQNTLAKECVMSSKQVSRYIKVLIENRLIIAERRRRKNGSLSSNTYKILEYKDETIDENNGSKAMCSTGHQAENSNHLGTWVYPGSTSVSKSTTPHGCPYLNYIYNNNKNIYTGKLLKFSDENNSQENNNFDDNNFSHTNLGDNNFDENNSDNLSHDLSVFHLGELRSSGRNGVVKNSTPKLKAEDFIQELHTILGGKQKLRSTDKLKKKLKTRSQTFTIDEIRKAAEFISKDSFLMGDNPNKKRYATVEYLLRDESKLENWLQEADDSSERIDNEMYRRMVM